MDTDSLQRGELLITKISRLCLNDLSFTKSYIEMPLKCQSSSSMSLTSMKPIEYNELISAKLVRNKLNNNENYLIGIFQQTQHITFNKSLTNNNNERQAICIFQIKQIQSKLKENLSKCYNSQQTSEQNKIQ